MRPRMVAVGIDTLNVGLNIGRWLMEEAEFKRLEEAKAEAGVSLFGGKGVTVQVGGREFNLLPKGSKGYDYVMFNDDVRLLMARNCLGGAVFPEVFTELNSVFLWGKGYNRAYSELSSWVRTWADVVGEKVNRVDLCVDLAVDLPRLDVACEVVTRTRKKVDYFEVEQYTNGRRDTGYRFGVKPIMARLYDKTYEIRKSDKYWFGDIWRNGGWDGKSNITRAEFQVRRPCLREYGINSYDELVAEMPDIWRYLTEEWISLRAPNGSDSNHRRWETSELWGAVREAGSHFGECLGVHRWKQKHARIEPLMAQMKGLMVSEVALDSMIRGEHFAIDRLRSEVNAYFASEEFHAKLLDRRGRYANLSN